DFGIQHVLEYFIDQDESPGIERRDRLSFVSGLSLHLVVTFLQVILESPHIGFDQRDALRNGMGGDEFCGSFVGHGGDAMTRGCWECLRFYTLAAILRYCVTFH